MSKRHKKTIQANAAAQAMTLQGTAEITAEAAAEGKPAKKSFKIAAYSGGLLRVSAFYRPVVVDLAGLRAGPGGRVTVLKDHDSSQIVGQGVAKISATEITVEGSITGDASDKASPAGQVVVHAGNGFVWAASVGVGPERVEFVDAGQKVTVNGQEFTGPINVVRAGRLGEVSFVAIGADETAQAQVAATAAGSDVMNFAEWLKAKGFEFDKLSDSQKASLQAMYDGEKKPADKPVEKKVEAAGAIDIQAQIEDARKQYADEAKRVEKIRLLAAQYKSPTMKEGTADVSIEAHAIEKGISADAAELIMLRHSRPSVPNVIVTAGWEAKPEILEAAVCMNGKLANAEKAYKPEVLEAASKRFRHGIGLQELFMEAAWANGYSGRTFKSDPSAVLRAAFGAADISGILSNVANKFLLAGFMAVEDSWRRISSVRSVSDFKAVTSYRLTGDFDYDEVGPTGELKHGEIGEESFSNQAKTYGKMFSITRQDQINDDLGALTVIPTRIGRGAALKLNTVFWTVFLDNAAFFVAGNNNYQEGAATALSIASLTAAELLFLNQTNPNGDPLGIAPEILLVPNALHTLGTQLTRDLEVRDTTASTKYTTSNPHAGKFAPVRSSYLSNSTISGYSAAAWYLLANPATLSTIEVAFLNGNQSPTVETAEADFNVLGVQMRGYHDFGVAKQDTRGGVKSKGTA